MIYVFIGNVVQHICNIYNICLMPMPFYGEKMEINYGNLMAFSLVLNYWEKEEGWKKS